MKRILIILLLSLNFSQEGEIQNVTAAQRTDGSGIVDISYELLPDATFPSFEVSAYLLNGGASITWSQTQNGNGWNIYLNTGPYNVTNLYMYLCMEILTNFAEDYSITLNEYYGNSDNGFWSDYYNNSDDEFIFELSSIYTENPLDMAYIPSGTTDLLLFTIIANNGNVASNGGIDGCIPGMSLYFNNYNYSDYNIDVVWGEQGDDFLNPITAEGDGIGENILPGAYNLTWQAPANNYTTDNIIRIVAYSHIVDSELPFDMVNIPSGTYYDWDSDIQTIDYNYEIMKYDLTNEDIATWALNPEVECYDPNQGTNFTWSQIQGFIGSSFNNINFDGNVIEIEPGYGTLPVVASNWNYLFNSNYPQADVIQCFIDYYGLRLPTRGEWLYAARGEENIPFPWYEGEYICEELYYNEDEEGLAELACEDYFNWTNDENNNEGFDIQTCLAFCYTDAFCSNNSIPLPSTCEGQYTGGQYENASPFGVYDMLGNTSNIIIENNETYFFGGYTYSCTEVYDDWGLLPDGDCEYTFDPENNWFELTGDLFSSSFYYNWASEIGSVGIRLVRTVAE